MKLDCEEMCEHYDNIDLPNEDGDGYSYHTMCKKGHCTHCVEAGFISCNDLSLKEDVKYDDEAVKSEN